MDFEKFTFNKFQEEKYVLPCGLTIQYFPYPDYHTNYMGFVVPFGSNMSEYSINGKRVKTGIAHFLEHRMFDSEKGDIAERFARIGASCNAYTYFDRTCYYCSTIYDPMDAFKILFEQITSFYSSKERVINERSIIIQEMLEGISDPVSEMSVKMNYRMFEDGVFKNQIIGTKKDISSTTREDLVNAYNAFYRLSEMTLVVVGPVDIHLIIDYINKNALNISYKKLEVKKICPKEKFIQKKFTPLYLKRETSERVQGISFKIDVTDLKKNYSMYEYEKIMDYSLSLLFDIGSDFMEEFNKLDVAYNSFSYQFTDVDNVGLFSIKYLSDNGRIPNKFILDCLKNPQKYLNDENIKKYEIRTYGRHLMMLQNASYLFETVTLSVEKGHNFLELFSKSGKCSMKDIIYFVNTLSKGIILKGVLIPKDGGKNDC